MRLNNRLGRCLAAVIVAYLALAGTAMATPPKVEKSGPKGRICQVANDIGGNLYVYQLFRASLAEDCDQLKLGDCNSACTILMTLPNACLLPQARFGFHGTNLGALGNYLLARHYQAGIRDTFEQEWSRSRRITHITAQEAVALDPTMRICSN